MVGLPISVSGGEAGRTIDRDIVKRFDVGKVVVLPKRWISERTIEWLNRRRRLATGCERLIRSELAVLRGASIRLTI